MQLISYLDSNQDEVVDSLEWTIRLNEALSFEFEMDEIQDVVRKTNGRLSSINSFSLSNSKGRLMKNVDAK